jgi:hypothetical protein
MKCLKCDKELIPTYINRYKCPICQTTYYASDFTIECKCGYNSKGIYDMSKHTCGGKK